jgi:glycosyltransferase involved in cell wall biosynthesis
MKASFVIPVYNGSAYIAETIDSCVRQGLKDIEVIVVDDGSSDKTTEIIEYFVEKDKRISLIKSPTNMGRSNARNIGIEKAQSDIILCSDADDISHPNRAKETIKFFNQNPECSLVSTKAQAIDELGNVIGWMPVEPFTFDNVLKDKQTRIVHSSMAFRKIVFEKVKYTTGDYCKHGIDDWKFQVDAHKSGFKFGFINKTLVQYRLIPKKRDEAKIAELKNLCLA